MTRGERGELRLGLTISGAIALGAFEGGALAALLAAVQGANEQRREGLRIDAIAGASAGSITAVLVARVLAAGLNPVDTMYGAWVKAPQLEDLRDGRDSPLSVKHTSEQAAELLNGPGVPARAQTTPVMVNMALGCLRGLDYRIGSLRGAPIEASTYLDWAEHRIGPDCTVESLVEPGGPVDAALASGAHAAAFPPSGLDRSADRVQRAYERNHVVNFPDSKYLWYTDGGTIDNEPLGRTLDLTEEIDDNREPRGDADRLHLMITPDPGQRRPQADPWSTPPEPAPTWARTGLRTLKLLRVQHLYDDLRRVEKTNSRIAWTRQVEDALVRVLTHPERDAVGDLDGVSDAISDQKAALFAPEGTPAPESDTDSAREAQVRDALRRALGSATGLGGKHEVRVAVVSPLVLPEVADGSKTARELLAGAFLGHFGGFMDPGLRENDFALGYRCMLRWLDEENGLEGLDPTLARAGVHRAHAACVEWAETNERCWVNDRGGEHFNDQPLREKLRMLILGFQAARMAFRQVRGDDV